MKIHSSLLSFIFCLASFVAGSQTKSTNIQTINGASYYIHKVEKGQSLYSISKLYNVSLDDIYAVNPEVKTGARADQEIKIPVKGSNASSTNTVAVKTNTATATAGSATVSSSNNTISVRSNTAPLTVTVNPNLPIDTNQYYTYKVARRETFYSISKKFNLTEAELKIFNPSLANGGLKEGQTIIVGEKKRVADVPVVQRVYTHPDSSNPNVIHKPKKQSYSVALILPFKLDQTLAMDPGVLVKNNSGFPAVPALAVDFYLGFKRAVDSLTSKDFEVSIDLYDVDDKDSAELFRMVNDPKFKQTDFIFGPLYPSGFKVIAQKAKELGIPIVSPITQQNKMLYENVYVSKTNPSQFTLLESLADYCIDSLVNSNANIMVIAAPANKEGKKDPKEEAYVKAFKKYYNERQKALGKSAKDTVTVVKGLAGVKLAYQPGVKNIIIMLISNQVFIQDFITQLAIYADKKDITLCGWENISTTDNLDQEYLNQLHYTFPTQNNITNTGSYASIIESYREQQNAYPGDYYFRGFDIGYYYLKNMREAGTDFVFNLGKLTEETNYTRFKFVRPDNLTGFDNRGAYIFRYNEYQLQRTGWK